MMKLHPMRESKNIVVLRPGALGDVLVCRHLLCRLRSAFPEARLVFVAPGERGRLLARFGLADEAQDWEGAAFAWLFSRAEGAPPEPLRRVFAASFPETLVFAWLDLAGGEAAAFRERVAAINPGARVFLAPSRPAAGSGMYIGEWMAREVSRFCGAPPGAPVSLCGGEAGLTVDAAADAAALVMHPGSGSSGKNWPLASFAALAALLSREKEQGGLGVRRIRIVAGEADGTLGEALAAMLPGAELIRGAPLPELAGVLAGAGLFLGNDSGPAHLAAAVRTREGEKPKVAVVFGPGDPGIWAAPGVLALDAGPAMDRLPPEKAFALLKAFYTV